MCSIQFDRKDIPMNKMVATTLEAKFHVYDLRTYHPKKGFTSLSEKVSIYSKLLSCTGVQLVVLALEPSYFCAKKLFSLK